MSYVSLQIGQCGNQLGCSFFNTLAEIVKEEGNTRNVNFLSETEQSFFTKCEKNDQRFPRAVLIDTEPKVINEIINTARDSKFCYRNDSYKIQQQGSGNNWAMGYSLHGPSFKNSMLDLVQKEAERCDFLSGFLLFMSAAGGTGSGLGAYLSEIIKDEFPRVSSANLIVWPFQKGEVTVQAYNAILSLAHLQNTSDVVISFENDQLSKLCQQRMGLRQVSLYNLNSVASQQLVNFFLPCKRSCPITPMFDDLLCHLVPHPQFKLVGLRSLPQEPLTSLPFSAYNWPGLLRTLRRMVLYNSIVDEIYGRCSTQINVTKNTPVSLSNLLILRGKDSEKADPQLLHQPSLPYASWVPPASRLQTWVHPSSFLNYTRTATLANNGQLSIPCIEVAIQKFWRLFAAKAYMHHFTQYGLSKEDFEDSLVQVEQIVASYKSLKP